MSSKSEHVEQEIKKSQEQTIALLRRAIEIEELKLRLEQLRHQRILIKGADNVLYADKVIDDAEKDKALQEFTAITPLYHARGDARSSPPTVMTTLVATVTEGSPVKK